MYWTRKKQPADGDIRERLRFAWFPIATRDNKIIWLEHYLQIDIFYNRVRWIQSVRWSKYSRFYNKRSKGDK